MQIHPNVFRFKIPLPDNPLGFVNVHLIKTDQGSILIDAGWNTDAAYQALLEQMDAIGTSVDDLRYIVLTHIHPDHFGLARRLKESCQAQVIMHMADNMMIDEDYVDYRKVLSEMDHWLAIHGVPDQLRMPMNNASRGIGSFMRPIKPDLVVNGGEHLILGEFDLEIIWTPGHSPGHICLYERNYRLLFSGDHVLPKTTPNVSMHTQMLSNPLVDYLNALEQVAELDVEWVLPGHDDAFQGLKERVQVILDHHEENLATMLAAFENQRKTAFEIATIIPWTKGRTSWRNLDPMNQRFAITETIPHLELLVARDLLKKTLHNGVIWYEPD